MHEINWKESYENEIILSPSHWYSYVLQSIFIIIWENNDS